MERLITTSADSVRSVFPADVDGDSDVDVLPSVETPRRASRTPQVVVASNEDDTVAWHENDGDQSFTEQIITTTAEAAICVVAEDVDGSGTMDVLAGVKVSQPSTHVGRLRD